MSKIKKVLLITMGFAGLTNYSFFARAFATEPTDKDITSTKHFHFPFVHVDVARHKDGTKDYDVKAPFTKVHNPAGPNNAYVKAPFTEVDHNPNGTVKNTKTPAKTGIAQKSNTQ